MTKLTIEYAINGYVLSYYDEELKKINYIVVEEQDVGDNEARTTQKLLYAIQEHFGLLGSKHDSERCYVKVEDKNGKEVIG